MEVIRKINRTALDTSFAVIVNLGTHRLEDAIRETMTWQRERAASHEPFVTGGLSEETLVSPHFDTVYNFVEGTNVRRAVFVGEVSGLDNRAFMKEAVERMDDAAVERDDLVNALMDLGEYLAGALSQKHARVIYGDVTLLVGPAPTP